MLKVCTLVSGGGVSLKCLIPLSSVHVKTVSAGPGTPASSQATTQPPIQNRVLEKSLAMIDPRQLPEAEYYLKEIFFQRVLYYRLVI
jgi:hypothetical protein